ncbi:sel1 domain-containing protein [Nannochloropsis oceanica]
MHAVLANVRSQSAERVASLPPSSPHPLLVPAEVARLKALAEMVEGMEEGKEVKGWKACKELGIRYLTYGKTRVDLEHAVEWLETAGTRTTPSIPPSLAHRGDSRGGVKTSLSPALLPPGEEDAELWYARGIACLRLDGKDGKEGGEEEEREGWTEEVETETYGAQTGPEFVRVVKRRANKERKARGKEGGGEGGRVQMWHRRGIRRLVEAGKRGHVEAMVMCGNLLYENGNVEGRRGGGRGGGTEEGKTNLELALEWYWKAVGEGGREGGLEGGHPDAWYNLGRIYAEGGKGVKRDVDRAKDCFEKAARHPEEKGGAAAYMLGHLCRGVEEGGEGGKEGGGDVRKAVEWWKEACDIKDHPAACYDLALLYRNGEGQVPPSYSLYRHYIAKAEGLGDAEALFHLGHMYLQGEEGGTEEGREGEWTRIEKNEGKAKEYFERAGREGGHAEAMTTMGVLRYREGRWEEAARWYEAGGEAGSEEAWRNLASMYIAGEGVAKDEGMARNIVKILLKKK